MFQGKKRVFFDGLLIGKHWVRACSSTITIVHIIIFHIKSCISPRHQHKPEERGLILVSWADTGTGCNIWKNVCIILYILSCNPWWCMKVNTFIEFCAIILLAGIKELKVVETQMSCAIVAIQPKCKFIKLRYTVL